MSDAIKISGRRSGIDIFVEPRTPFGMVVRTAEKKIYELKKFLKNSDIQITFSGRRMTDSQRALLEHKVIRCLDESVRVRFAPSDGAKAEIYRGVVRSGACIRSDGNLTVLGDVNPGAYLYAEGSINVMGSLRGVAAAGCGGDERVFVAACDMRPEQIRIAGIIARSPADETAKKRDFAEIAELSDGKIVISRLN